MVENIWEPQSLNLDTQKLLGGKKMSEINDKPDKKEFRLKLSYVQSQGKYYRWRILSFPDEILSGTLNGHGEYMINIRDDGDFELVLSPSWRNRKN